MGWSMDLDQVHGPRSIFCTSLCWVSFPCNSAYTLKVDHSQNGHQTFNFFPTRLLQFFVVSPTNQDGTRHREKVYLLLKLFVNFIGVDVIEY